MREKVKKWAVWLIAVAAVMGIYTLSFQREYNQYRTTSSFQGVVQEVLLEEDRIIVEEAQGKDGQDPRSLSVPTENADQFQVGDSVKVTWLERVDKRHTGLKDQRVELEKVK